MRVARTLGNLAKVHARTGHIKAERLAGLVAQRGAHYSSIANAASAMALELCVASRRRRRPSFRPVHTAPEISGCPDSPNRAAISGAISAGGRTSRESTRTPSGTGSPILKSFFRRGRLTRHARRNSHELARTTASEQNAEHAQSVQHASSDRARSAARPGRRPERLFRAKHRRARRGPKNNAPIVARRRWGCRVQSKADAPGAR